MSDERMGRDMSIACRDHLGARVEYLGALERDECVRDAVRLRRPVVQLFPRCQFAQDLEIVAERFLRVARREAQAGSRAIGPRAAHVEEEPLASYGLFADGGRRPSPSGSDDASGHVALEPLPAPAHSARSPLPALDPSRPGAWLRRCREHLGLSLRELARETRIRCLDSIEGERFDRLPPAPYLRGFVLQYARALGIEEAEIVAEKFLERARRAAPRVA